jgi:hypothetical protein
MHELTASEATTLLSVLSRGGGGGISEIDPLGIPPSTFFATRRRIYAAGWLTDRYVPNPWAIGVLAIDCVLAKPGPADRARLERDWAASASNVILWSGMNVLLGIFFRQDDRAPGIENGNTVSIAAGSGSLPVYFDYSRAWSRFIRVEKETGYPRPLGVALPPTDGSTPSAVPGLILEDQEDGSPPPRARRWHSLAGLSRSEQRLLECGVVRSRTFINLDAVPPYDGRALGEIVFVTGELREGVTSADVLGALNNECRVSPLLLAEDGTKILIPALGQVGAGASRRTRLRRAAVPVAATLDSMLTNLQMTIEHTDSVRRLIDHRYDRLFRTGRGVREDGAGVRS